MARTLSDDDFVTICKVISEGLLPKIVAGLMEHVADLEAQLVPMAASTAASLRGLDREHLMVAMKAYDHLLGENAKLQQKVGALSKQVAALERKAR